MFQDYFQIWYVHSTSYSKTNNICFIKIDQVVLEIVDIKSNPFTYFVIAHAWKITNIQYRKNYYGFFLFEQKNTVFIHKIRITHKRS